MKLYIPFIGDILKLKESWTFEIGNNRELVKVITGLENITDNIKITIPVNSEIKVDKFEIKKGQSDNCLKFKLIKLGDTKIKYVDFYASIRDVNRINIFSSSTTGVLNFSFNWHLNLIQKDSYLYQDRNLYLHRTGDGFVNDVLSFRVTVIDLITSHKKNSYNNTTKEYADKVTYQLYCLHSGKVVGEYNTLITLKNHAKKYVESNKKYYLNEEQKVLLREEKFERVCKFDEK